MTLPKQAKRKYPDREPIVYWHMWTAEWKTVCEQICDMYNESQTKYEVIPLSIPGSVGSTKFMLGVAGNNPPDLMTEWDPVIPKFAESELLYKLDEYMTPQELAYFNKNAFPIAKKIGMYKNHIYGMCVGSDIYAIYYRIDDLKKKGFNPDNFPKKLEELTKTAHKLNEFDDKGNLKKICFLPRNLLDYNAIFGQGFYDWKSNKITINTPDNLRALKYLLNERMYLGFD
jgi:multiple sugar transport system substrate-binding protein